MADKIRDADGVYFRVKRDNKWQSICFSDLTELEQDEVMKGRDDEWLKSLCKILANTIIDLYDYTESIMPEEI